MHRNNQKHTDEIMKQECEISIIIPAFNASYYIENCLKSILAQNFKDFEIIIVNDFSSDNTEEIIRHYSHIDKRIVILKNEQNIGQAKSRNIGISKSKGKYLYYIDADDELFNYDSIKCLYSIAEEYDSDEVIGGVYKWHPEDNRLFQANHLYYLQTEKRNTTLAQYPQIRSNVVVWNKLYKKSFLIENNILYFDENLRRFEDNPYAWKSHSLAKSISITTKPTYLYRQPPNCSDYQLFWLNKVVPQIEYLFEGYSNLIYFFDKNKSLENIRHHIEGSFALILVLVTKYYNQLELDNNSIQFIFSEYRKLFKRLPQKSLNNFPNSIKKILEDVDQYKYETAWQSLKNDIDTKIQNPDEIPVLLEDYKTRFPYDSKTTYFPVIDIPPPPSIPSSNNDNTKDSTISIESVLEKIRVEENLNIKLSLQIRKIYESKSWRVTKPFRNLSTFLQRM
jgi:glycosyltransferase involved in cell wall biosynthesis